MASWRVQYKDPNGTLQQTSLELKGVRTAGEVRELIIRGGGDLYVAADALVAVEKIEDWSEVPTRDTRRRAPVRRHSWQR